MEDYIDYNGFKELQKKTSHKGGCQQYGKTRITTLRNMSISYPYDCLLMFLGAKMKCCVITLDGD